MGRQLTLRTDAAIRVPEGVLLDVRVQELLGVLVLESDGVVVTDLLGVEEELVARKSLLERRRHEGVARTGELENLEVNPEEGEVDDERNDDETNGAVDEVAPEVGLRLSAVEKTKQAHHRVAALDVEDTPEVPDNSSADGKECEEADHLAPEGEGKGGACRNHPEPPVAAELAVTLLVELDVAEEGERHEENEGGVEENKACLGNVPVVCRQLSHSRLTYRRG